MTARHVIEWRFDKFFARVEPKLVCQSDPDELCRTKPSHLSGCECEEFFEIGSDDRGWYHVVEVEDDETEKMTKYLHRHEFTTECNIETWMNEDPMESIMEGYVGEKREIYLAVTTIDPVWEGEGYGWRLAGTT